MREFSLIVIPFVFNHQELQFVILGTSLSIILWSMLLGSKLKKIKATLGKFFFEIVDPRDWGGVDTI